MCAVSENDVASRARRALKCKRSGSFGSRAGGLEGLRRLLGRIPASKTSPKICSGQLFSMPPIVALDSCTVPIPSSGYLCLGEEVQQSPVEVGSCTRAARCTQLMNSKLENGVEFKASHFQDSSTE